MDAEIELHGLHLPRRHPAIAFGDGGGMKSYIGLFLAGELSRLGSDMPVIQYARCERPLVHEQDRIRRIADHDQLNFGIFDSVAFACDGPPENADVAARYFQALRPIRIGSFHIAHINKSAEGDQKPFGSAFWHNGARATWFIKPAEVMPNSSTVSVGIFPRKRNLGALPSATGFEFTFDDALDRVSFRRVDLADVSDLADRLPLRQRMVRLLRRGALAPELIADELQAEIDTVKRTARRYKQQFTVLPGGRLGLLERGA